MPDKRWVVYPRKKEDLVTQLLLNRGIKTQKQREEFFNPPKAPFYLASIGLKRLGISGADLKKAVTLVKEFIKGGKPIVIWGDYDVDGLCGAAILWEAIYRGLGYRNVRPYIPNRFTEGYGLSREGIDSLDPATLIITVDCGITAQKEIDYALSLGMTVVVTDHHTQEKNLKGAIVLWTKEVAGAAIAWVLANALVREPDKDLDLVALATVADIQPLLGPNRALVKAGLMRLKTAPRPGLKALIAAAGLSKREIGSYEIGWILAPRLNASGRLESALEALRLLCTKDPAQAREIAAKLSSMNSERQDLTLKNLEHAKGQVTQESPLYIVWDESYHEGVIGLVAGRIAQEFHRPAIVVSKGEKLSKGSARSIEGFDIIAAIRSFEDILIGAGGHPMAAGFTIETSKLSVFSEGIVSLARKAISPKLLEKSLKIDAEISLSEITSKFMRDLDSFEPYGIGNPRPLFLTKGAKVLNFQPVGKDNAHLKLLLAQDDKVRQTFKAVAFKMGDWVQRLSLGAFLDLVFSLNENEWNGTKDIELLIKDIHIRK